jgi:hypothetical protein
MDLRTEDRRRLLALEVKDNEQYIEGGLKLIGEFLKGSFISGLRDERVRVIVKTKGEDDSLAQIIETAIQEENEVKSQKYRNPPKEPSMVSEKPSRKTREDRRYSWWESGEVMATSALKNCYNCLKPGHIARIVVVYRSAPSAAKRDTR